MWKSILLATGLGIFWIASGTSANAQTFGRYTNAGAGQNYNAVYNRPTVSPYVNLGISSTGLSTYQTQVRPMLDEQQAIERQANALEQLNRQVRGSDPRVAEWQPGVVKNRFMRYSHYFGTVR